MYADEGAVCIDPENGPIMQDIFTENDFGSMVEPGTYHTWFVRAADDNSAPGLMRASVMQVLVCKCSRDLQQGDDTHLERARRVPPESRRVRCQYPFCIGDIPGGRIQAVPALAAQNVAGRACRLGKRAGGICALGLIQPKQDHRWCQRSRVFRRHAHGRLQLR